LAILTNIGNPGAVLDMGEVQAAARTLGLEPASLEIRRALRGRSAPEKISAMPSVMPVGQFIRSLTTLSSSASAGSGYSAVNDPVRT
jgi:hypothetical protein